MSKVDRSKHNASVEEITEKIAKKTQISGAKCGVSTLFHSYICKTRGQIWSATPNLADFFFLKKDFFNYQLKSPVKQILILSIYN